MISKQTFQFLKELKTNNNRDWFNANKEKYLVAIAEFEVFVNLLIQKIGQFDKDVVSLNAKDCIFRIYRDVRFSKDKSPYKPHFGAWIVKGGRKSEQGAGYYVHIEPDNCFLAGGAYMPPADWLEVIRREIYHNGKELKKILSSASFKKYFKEIQGEQLQRPPRGYDANHPDIELLKRKSFLAMHKMSNNAVITNNSLKYCAEVFKALSPFDRFFNKAIQ